jgi:hypothetical protein
MRKPTKTAATQLGLFPASTQIQQALQAIDPKIVALLARLLRQYADRETVVASRPEAGHQ